MADVYCIVNQIIKLADRTPKININEPLAYDNAKAHAFRVTVFNDNGPENLTGVECKGSFTPSGKNTLTPIPGEIIGENMNIAQVILPAACYVNPGRFEFTMNLTKQDGTSRTVLWVKGHIDRNRTQTIEAPTEVIDVDQVIMEASAAASEARGAAADAEGFSGAIAPTFEDVMATSPFVPLTARAQHVWYDGVLYVNKVDINTAEAWNASHWNAVDVSGELYAVNNRIDDFNISSNIWNELTNAGEYTLTADNFESGIWNITKKEDNDKRARIKSLIPVRKGMVLSFSYTTFEPYFNVWAQNNNSNIMETPVQTIGWVKNFTSNLNHTILITADGYLSILFRNASDANAVVDPAAYNSHIIIKTASNVGALQNTSETYANLTNTGEYTLKASDFESGMWSYSTKSPNAARARIKYLIPVRRGMIFSYSSQTYDIYFGVLSTPYARPIDGYAQGGVWFTNQSGYVNINVDGYMVVIIRDHNDITAEVDPSAFDGVVVIKTNISESLSTTSSTVDKLENDLVFNPENYQYNSGTSGYYQYLATPILYLDGDTEGMSKNTKKNLNARFKDINMGCSVKWQGSSSIAYPKKNYTITFSNPVVIRDNWGLQKKYVLKSEFMDNTHTRNTVSARLWAEIVRDREMTEASTTLDDESGTPITLEDGTTSIDIVDSIVLAAPGCGANDGFHVMIVMNGKYIGLYTMGIPKDDWMFAMDKCTENCCVLNAEKNCDTTRFKTTTTATDIKNGQTFSCEFATDDMLPEANGEKDYSIIASSVNTMLNAVMSASGTNTYRNTIDPYLNMGSAIDYLIYSMLIGNWDGVSHNYNLSTYDGVRWRFNAYDLDNTFGMEDLSEWSFEELYDNPVEVLPSIPYAYTNRLFYLILKYGRTEFKERYNYLRSTILSENNIYTKFYNFICVVSKRVLAEEYNVWPTTPRSGAQTVDAIINFYRLRCQYIDQKVASDDTYVLPV